MMESVVLRKYTTWHMRARPTASTADHRLGLGVKKNRLRSDELRALQFKYYGDLIKQHKLWEISSDIVMRQKQVIWTTILR